MPRGCPEDARVWPQELLELLGTRRCILQMLFIRDFHRQRPHGCFYLFFWGGGGKRQEQHNQQLLRCWLVYLAC